MRRMIRYEECSDNSSALANDAVLMALSCKRIASLRAKSISEVRLAS
jgi:hypothetical protein